MGCGFKSQPNYLKTCLFLCVDRSSRTKDWPWSTYTQYDYRSGSSDEYELITNDDIEHNVNRASGENKKNNEFGVIASVGVDYRIWQQLHIGAGVDYYADSQANATTFMLTSRYQF